MGSGTPRVGQYAQAQEAQYRIYGTPPDGDTHTHAVPPAKQKAKNALYNTYLARVR